MANGFIEIEGLKMNRSNAEGSHSFSFWQKK